MKIVLQIHPKNQEIDIEISDTQLQVKDLKKLLEK